MTEDQAPKLISARALGTAPYARTPLVEFITEQLGTYRFDRGDQRRVRRALVPLFDALDELPGATLQERWGMFETRVWARWASGTDRPPLGERWSLGPWMLVISRLVQPSWQFASSARISLWLRRLPADDSLLAAERELDAAMAHTGYCATRRRAAVLAGLRLLVVRGRDGLAELTDEDVHTLPPLTVGADILDIALCSLKILPRSPLRGIARHQSRGRLSYEGLVEVAGVPPRFRPVTMLYLEAYGRRLSNIYTTQRHKTNSLAHFWRYMEQHYPEVTECAAITPAMARGFVPFALELARTVQHRLGDDTEDRTTGYAWLINVRTFFADICTWATEPGSPFQDYAPPMVPLTRHDLLDRSFKQARERKDARMTATVLDLQREMPNIRAFALRRWREAAEALAATPDDPRRDAAERDVFWDWALLELLLSSGVRIEEAGELTTLDVLKRQLADGRVYYLLHIKPSKFGRARVIPIGDVLGRVIAEIIRHVRRFYHADAVPAIDRRDHHEKQPLPRLPYLLQGASHPSAIGITTVRARLRRLSLGAGARHANGSPIELLPHDCRRVFASEHLNHHTPVHVIQALLGHATLDTILVYAKLYPSELVEQYRRALHGVYTGLYGDEAQRAPTAEEWHAFSASCSLRDMGTHLCALPMGDHCSRGLVCLGCGHAQPKKSALPVFRQMLSSHQRALDMAQSHGEPAGQIAARELEVERIHSALRRAEELSEDVATAIEAAAG